MFTRMIFSLVATGIAPGSFYELDADGNRQRAHYDGLPVEFVAEAISTLGAPSVVDGFQSYHVMNPHDDGIGLDEFVDWLIEAGYRSSGSTTTTIGCSGSRPPCARCRTAAPALGAAAAAPTRARAAAARIDRTDRPVPCGGAGRENRPGQRHSARHAAVIAKYVSDLRLMGLL